MQFSGARRPRGAAVGHGVAWGIVWVMPKTPMQCSLNFTARWAPFGDRRPRSLDLTRLPSSQFTMTDTQYTHPRKYGKGSRRW